MSKLLGRVHIEDIDFAIELNKCPYVHGYSDWKCMCSLEFGHRGLCDCNGTYCDVMWDRTEGKTVRKEMPFFTVTELVISKMQRKIEFLEGEEQDREIERLYEIALDEYPAFKFEQAARENVIRP